MCLLCLCELLFGGWLIGWLCPCLMGVVVDGVVGWRLVRSLVCLRVVFVRCVCVLVVSWLVVG